MDNLISRQEAIDGFYEMASDIDHLCTVGDYILFLESFHAAPRWTPCKKRLPEESGMYIVSGKRKVWVCKFTRINIAGVKIGGWENDARNPVVTAWMPLPEPYKEEDGG